MKPTDFYQASYFKNKTKRTLHHQQMGAGAKFKFYDGSLSMAFLNNIIPPTDSDIALLQQNIAKQRYTIEDKNLLEWLKATKRETTPDKVIYGDITYEQVMNIIEQVFQKWVNGDKVGYAELFGNFTVGRRLEDYKQAAEALTQVVEILDKEQGFANTKEFKVLKNTVERASEKLKADIASRKSSLKGNQTYFGTSRSRVGTKDATAQITGLGNEIKGRIAENIAFRFFSQIPNEFILDTAHIEIGVDRTKARTDIMSFNKDIISSLKFTCSIGGKPFTGTLEEIQKESNDMLNKGENNIIHFDNNEWNRLINHGTGVQIKSGVNAMSNPFNKDTGVLSINDLAVVQHTYQKTLNALVEWYAKSAELHDGKSIVYATGVKGHPATLTYDSYFNYCASHLMTKVLGKENNILVLRGQIYTVEEYLREIWKYKKYLRAGKPVDISQPNKQITMSIRSSQPIYGSNN